VIAGVLLYGVLGIGACGGGRYRVADAPRAAIADVLQFDNQATMYVDVYLVADQIQWRLGRIPAGMRTTVRVPDDAIDWTTGFVKLTVIPGSQFSAEAWRDPRAVAGIAQPVSAVLSQRWTFRVPAGAGMQLLSAPLRQP
jgi:hypothetical protein